MSKSIYFVATEPSGDVLAAEVMQEILNHRKDVQFAGVGGTCMSKLGIDSPFDIRELAVFGLIEGLKAYKTVKRRVEDTAQDIISKQPTVLVLVDSWGFMWRVAKRVKELGYNGARIKLVGPQVWATRPKRARTLAAHVEHLLCIHEFEEPFYKPYGLRTTVIGNPALDRDENGNGLVYRKKRNIAESKEVILLLLGSRKSEIKNVAPVLVKAAEKVCQSNSNCIVLCIVSNSVRHEVEALSENWSFPYLLEFLEQEKSDAFAAADVSLTCSGTVTTEVAQQGVPLIVGYKVGWLTWAIARVFLMKSKYITLLNVAADKEIAKEFIQTRFTSKKIALQASKLLGSPEVRKSQVAEQFRALDLMGRGNPKPSQIAAECIIEYLD